MKLAEALQYDRILNYKISDLDSFVDLKIV